MIMDPEQRILLHKRADLEVWALPSGAMELGESILDTLGREVAEETGIQVDAAELIGIYTDPRHEVSYPNGDILQVFSVAFLVTQWAGTPKVGDEESKDIRFFRREELPADVISWHREILEDVWSGRRGIVK